MQSYTPGYIGRHAVCAEVSLLYIGRHASCAECTTLLYIGGMLSAQGIPSGVHGRHAVCAEYLLSSKKERICPNTASLRARERGMPERQLPREPEREESARKTASQRASGKRMPERQPPREPEREEGTEKPHRDQGGEKVLKDSFPENPEGENWAICLSGMPPWWYTPVVSCRCV